MSERDLIRKWILWKEGAEGRPYTRKDLAESAGLSPTYLSSIMTGARNAGAKTIERIAAALEVPLSAFYAGPPDSPPGGNDPGARSGAEPREAHAGPVKPAGYDDRIPRIRSDLPEREQVAPGETGWKLSFVSERLFGYDLETNPPLLPETPPLAAPDSGRPAGGIDSVSPEQGIPILTEVPSGPWRIWPLSRGGGATIPRTLGAGKYAFSIRVGDDSMAPMLEAGMLLVVDPESAFSRFEGGVGVIVRRGTFIARRVFRRDDKIMIVPVNPAYQPETIDPAENAVFKVAYIIPCDPDTEL
jgi:SOS-response transcriptional repressor LexA